jgi:hypothetical protein
MTGELDRSLAGMRRFLREMVDLAGQTDEAHSAPVLELQFGLVTTRTTVTLRDGLPCLTVLATLPRSAQLPYGCWPAAALADGAGATELLWQADGGCHVIVRSIPVGQIADEPAALDAIMALADQAAAWFAEAAAANRAPG